MIVSELIKKMDDLKAQLLRYNPSPTTLVICKANIFADKLDVFRNEDDFIMNRMRIEPENPAIQGERLARQYAPY